LNLFGKADPVKKLDQADQSPERGDCLDRAAELNLARASNCRFDRRFTLGTAGACLRPNCRI